MAIYNMSFMDNSTNILQLASGVGQALGNEYLIGYLFLLSFFLLLLILSSRFDYTEVLIIDGFLSTILAVLLYAAQMLPPFAIVYPAIVLVISTVLLLFVNK